jgi:hypothetical protein
MHFSYFSICPLQFATYIHVLFPLFSRLPLHPIGKRQFTLLHPIKAIHLPTGDGWAIHPWDWRRFRHTSTAIGQFARQFRAGSSIAFVILSSGLGSVVPLEMGMLSN